MQRHLPGSDLSIHLFHGLSTSPHVAQGSSTVLRFEHLASRQYGLQHLGPWGLSSNPSKAWNRSGELKAARAEVVRIPARFGEGTIPIQFCSTWSQFRGCSERQTRGLLGGNTGVRVGHRPPRCPAGANAPNQGASYGVNVSSAVIRKRSYRRAMQRLGAQGFAKYRGKTFFGRKTFRFVAESQQQPGNRKRVRYAVWNCGGLSSQLYAEVLHWAKISDIEVLLLQETHWSQSSEWQDSDWYFIHSAASKRRTGGVLVGIRKSSVDESTLKWNELVPGRLLQVRGTLHGTPCDILNIYQKVRTAGSDEEIQLNLAERAKVWKKMAQCLGGLLYRNLVLMAGDLSTALPRTAGLTGNSAAKDQAGWTGIPSRGGRDCGCAAQGWSGCVQHLWKEAATVVHAAGESLIDYVFTRRASADATARRASAVATPLANWRKGGHKVLVGSIATNWAPWRQKPLDGRGLQTPVLRDGSTQSFSCCRGGSGLSACTSCETSCHGDAWADRRAVLGESGSLQGRGCGLFEAVFYFAKKAWTHDATASPAESQGSGPQKTAQSGGAGQS